MKSSSALASCVLLLSGTLHAYQIPTSCDVSQAALEIPKSQNNITAPPSNMKPKYIGIGLGIQNYTCSPSGTYEDAGQFIEILDASCLATDNVWKNLRKRDDSYVGPDDVWYHEYQIRALLGAGALRLGTQYSVSSPGGGLAAYYDFRQGVKEGDPSGYMSTKKEECLSAANPDQDLAWWKYSRVDGDLASYVYRVDTHYGAAPKTCTPGSPPIQVRYSAKYWFYDTPESAAKSFKSGTSNALAQNGPIVSSSPTLQKLLDFAPAILGLLAVVTMLSMLLVGFAIAHFFRTRRSSTPMRSAYRPVQLPRTTKPMESSYRDEHEAYGA